MGGRRRSTGMKKHRIARPSMRGTRGLTKRHITARLMQSFAPNLLMQIRDRAGQRGGGIGSFFGKVRRVAHKVLLSKTAGHILTGITNYRDAQLAKQGGSGILSTIGHIGGALLQILGLA